MSSLGGFITIVCRCFLLYKLLAINASAGSHSYCRQTLENPEVQKIDWPYLKGCLQLVNSEILTRNTSENVWRLMKLAFDSIDNIPSDSYKYMGYSLTSIPLDDLRNISMENVDVVEAFGAIRTETSFNEERKGFNAEQLRVIAQKVRSEWLGKNPKTYSEYDLKAMGEILCYFNVSELEKIHSIAFREAAEWIGSIEQCPLDRLRALAKIARRPDAFGEPSKWSKLEVSIIGNILNGLPANEINSIAKDKLQLNHFYKPNATKQQFKNKNKMPSNLPSASTVTTESTKSLTNISQYDDDAIVF